MIFANYPEFFGCKVRAMLFQFLNILIRSLNSHEVHFKFLISYLWSIQSHFKVCSM